MSPAAIPKLKAIVEADHKPSFVYEDEPGHAGCFRNAHMAECRCPLILAQEEATKMLLVSIGMAQMMAQAAEGGQRIEVHERQAVAQVRACHRSIDSFINPAHTLYISFEYTSKRTVLRVLTRAYLDRPFSYSSTGGSVTRRAWAGISRPTTSCWCSISSRRSSASRRPIFTSASSVSEG